jgi:hypothetical protein
MFAVGGYPIEIVELPGYQRDVEHVFSETERESLVAFLAANPSYGKVIPACGGVRKLRWRANGSGKRGGARVIYYFRDLNMPLYLLATYTKGEKADLTALERKQIIKLVNLLVEKHRAQWQNIIALQANTA